MNDACFWLLNSAGLIWKILQRIYTSSALTMERNQSHMQFFFLFYHCCLYKFSCPSPGGLLQLPDDGLACIAQLRALCSLTIWVKVRALSRACVHKDHSDMFNHYLACTHAQWTDCTLNRLHIEQTDRFKSRGVSHLSPSTATSRAGVEIRCLNQHSYDF